MLPDAPIPGPPLLSARALVVRRWTEEGRRVVLDGLDLELPSGRVVDVKGPSGSGKSTLLLALARLLPEWDGELRLEGRPAAQWEPEQWRRRVMLVPQKPALAPGTVRDNLLLPYAFKARDDVAPPPAPALRAGLDGLGLDDVDLDRGAARLSLGQAARVALLRALLTRPRVLLLDEPDAALDDVAAASVERVVESFAEEGGSVVRVRHARAGGRSDVLYRLAAGLLDEVPR